MRIPGHPRVRVMGPGVSYLGHDPYHRPSLRHTCQIRCNCSAMALKTVAVAAPFPHEYGFSLRDGQNETEDEEKQEGGSNG